MQEYVTNEGFCLHFDENPVCSFDPLEVVNEAIAVTDILVDERGRKFRVIDWNPSVIAGEFVTVAAKFLVIRDAKE